MYCMSLTVTTLKLHGEVLLLNCHQLRKTRKTDFFVYREIEFLIVCVAFTMHKSGLLHITIHFHLMKHIDHQYH